MIKLTQSQPSPGQTLIKVEGQLRAGSLAQLRGMVAGLSLTQVTIDLTGLVTIDDDGHELLIALRAAGCRLRGASLYINQLLAEG